VTLAVVLAVGAGLRMALVYRVPPLFMPGDSQSFLLPAYDLAHGLPFEPILKRPPGYPLLIASVMRVAGENLVALVFVQSALGLGTVAATYWIGRLAYGRAVGLLASLVTAVGGQLLIYEHYVLAESVFAFLLAAGVLAGVAACRWGRLPALAGGLTLGLATLFRPIAEGTLVLVLAIFLVAVRPRRRALALGACAVAGFLVVLAPPLLSDLGRQGGSSTGALGEVLLWRITRSESGYLARSDAPRAEPESPAEAARRYVVRRAADRTPPQEIYDGLRGEFGLRPSQADALMRDVALEAIARQPARYLWTTARMSIELFFAEDQRLGDISKRDGEARYSNPRSKQRTWFEERIAHLAEPPTEALQNEFERAELLTSIYQPGRYGGPLALLFAAGLVLAALGRPGRLGLLPGATVLLMLVANAALSGPEPRFRYPLDPLIAIVAAGGLVGLAGVVVRAGRPVLGRRRRTEQPEVRRPGDGRGVVPAS
jgi:hypothetical protein